MLKIKKEFIILKPIGRIKMESWIETANGTLIALDFIIKISHENIDDRYYSYIHTLHEKYDFLDLPDKYMIDGEEFELNGEDAINLNKLALCRILEFKRTLFSNEYLNESSWDSFLFEKKKKKNKVTF